eukprot:1038775-Amorphochlora_amoeboformis.AAC.1
MYQVLIPALSKYIHGIQRKERVILERIQRERMAHQRDMFDIKPIEISEDDEAEQFIQSSESPADGMIGDLLYR